MREVGWTLLKAAVLGYLSLQVSLITIEIIEQKLLLDASTKYTGFLLMLVNFISFHVLIVNATMNFTWLNTLIYFISFALSVGLLIGIHDESTILREPIVWVSIVIQVILVTSPFYLYKLFFQLVTHPEFSTIKG